MTAESKSGLRATPERLRLELGALDGQADMVVRELEGSRGFPGWLVLIQGWPALWLWPVVGGSSVLLAPYPTVEGCPRWLGRLADFRPRQVRGGARTVVDELLELLEATTEATAEHLVDRELIDTWRRETDRTHR